MFLSKYYKNVSTYNSGDLVSHYVTGQDTKDLDIADIHMHVRILKIAFQPHEMLLIHSYLFSTQIFVTVIYNLYQD